MNLTEAIALIQNSNWEKSQEIAEFLTQYFKTLETQVQTEKNSLKKQTETLLAVVAAEGDSIESKLEDAAKKIANLNTEKQNLEAQNQTLQTNLTTKDSELSNLKQDNVLAQAASKSGANINVLKALITADDKLEITGDAVSVNSKLIQDWAKEVKPDFVTSLFPKSHKDLQLPTGGSGSKPPEEKTVAQQYIDRNYQVPEQFLIK
jgi:chromosome segregation ATPase